MQCWCLRFIFILRYIFGLNTEFCGFLRLTCPFCNNIPSFKIYSLPNIIDCEFNELTLLCIFLNLIFDLIFQYLHFHDHTTTKRLFVSKLTCPQVKFIKISFKSNLCSCMLILLLKSYTNTLTETTELSKSPQKFVLLFLHSFLENNFYSINGNHVFNSPNFIRDDDQPPSSSKTKSLKNL